MFPIIFCRLVKAKWQRKPGPHFCLFKCCFLIILSCCGMYFFFHASVHSKRARLSSQFSAQQLIVLFAINVNVYQRPVLNAPCLMTSCSSYVQKLVNGRAAILIRREDNKMSSFLRFWACRVLLGPSLRKRWEAYHNARPLWRTYLYKTNYYLKINY